LSIKIRDSDVQNIAGHKTVQNKKEIKRIDWEITKRLVILLHYNSKIKKTNIAMKCNMSYDNCVVYLNWLEIMDLVRRETDENGFELISLNHKGEELFKKLKR
jgi:predicted transcriptional regulator